MTCVVLAGEVTHLTVFEGTRLKLLCSDHGRSSHWKRAVWHRNGVTMERRSATWKISRWGVLNVNVEKSARYKCHIPAAGDSETEVKIYQVKAEGKLNLFPYHIECITSVATTRRLVFMRVSMETVTLHDKKTTDDIITWILVIIDKRQLRVELMTFPHIKMLCLS